MEAIRIATAQFEHRSGDKKYNLSAIERLCIKAAEEDASAIAFHECSVSGYTFARKLSRSELLNVAEIIPEGETTRELVKIAARYNLHVLAGFFEKDTGGNIYNAYICVNGKGLVAKHRKLHPFINSNINPGNNYCVFEIEGWKAGILTCYDNNIIENVRATRLLGAEIIFMPHVTMCTPSTRPGAGFVDPLLWVNRESDPTSLRLEFDGSKGRNWLMKWLPARAYDNAVYCIFSNAIGMDEDQLKNGCSMILDPYGDILVECRKLGDDVQTAILTRDKLTLAGGYRYITARRPGLYGSIISQPHESEQKVVWLT